MTGPRRRGAARHAEESSTFESDVVSASDDNPRQKPLPSKAERWRTFRTRLLWTLTMIFSFFFIVAAGHAYCAGLVLIIVGLSYKEIINLKRKAHVDQNLPWFYAQRWYWFGLTLFASLHQYIIPVLGTRRSNFVNWLVLNHTLVTYLGIVSGSIFFVLSLRRYSIRYQFSQIALLIMTCLVVVSQGSAQIRTIYAGLLWFFVASTSVVANDISAYLFGSAYGKTKLIPRISPSKTVEGFLGASVITFVWALMVTELLLHFKVMRCPQTQFTLKPFAMWTQPACPTTPEFQLNWLETPHGLRHILPFLPAVYPFRWVWFHSSLLAAFASFVAPFGGFLASAFKRALKVKDFGDSIPGHGGVTDRFDCQLLMGMFTYLYLRTFVSGHRRVSVVSRLSTLEDSEKWDVAMALLNDLLVSQNLTDLVLMDTVAKRLTHE